MTASTQGQQAVSGEGPIKQRWRRFVALTPEDRLLLLKLWPALGGVTLLLRVLDYQRTRRFLALFLPDSRPMPAPSEAAMFYALRVGYLTRIASGQLPLNGSCLRQSLLVWWLLRRRRLPAELRIGVNKRGGFAAHAWVELDGRPVNDSADVADRFAAFDRVY